MFRHLVRMLVHVQTSSAHTYFGAYVTSLNSSAHARSSSRVLKATSSVVYKFSCSSCKATYYGKTSRHFIVRCREHIGVN